MKKTLSIALALLIFAFDVSGQKLEKPALKPVLPTMEQQQTIRDGVALHDAKKYDEAIAKYRSVLDANPNCTAAMYELSFSLAAKGERLGSMEVATKGAKYISDELPLFYVSIANTLDDLGKPQEAIGIYREGLKFLAGNNSFGKYRSSLFYNLGITYVKEERYAEARQALKSAVENDSSYASPSYWLSLVYFSAGYKIPAFLAASRFISLEHNSDRSVKAAATIVDILKAAPTDPKTGNIVINLNFNAPKDEGDFAMYDVFLGTVTGLRGEKDKNKTEEEMFIDAVETVIDLISEDKKVRSTFVGKNYVPFVIDLRRNGYVEALGYLVLSSTGNRLALKWLQINDDKVKNFETWAKAYRLPAR